MSISRSKGVLLAAGIAWLIVYFGCRLILDRLDLPEGRRVAVALLPAIPFTIFLVCAIANVRAMDELHRRVHLEALAFAFPVGIFVLMILGLLQLVIQFHPQRFNFRDAWPILCLLYFIGLALSWRRYS